MKGRIHRSPLAVTSDGTVVANLGQVENLKDVHAAVRRALQTGRPVFISVVLTQEEVAFLLKRLDNSGADALAWVLGKNPKKPRIKQEPKPEADQGGGLVTDRKNRTTAS